MADALYNAILGDSDVAEKPKSSTFNVGSNTFTEDEIDRLIKTESSKNPYAINKETKAMGYGQFTPETFAMLHKQGIKFDPFDEQESRGAIKTYLNKLVGQTGSKEGALKAYGGFVTKDPSSYIEKILSPNASKQETLKKPISNDPLYNAILGGEVETPKQQSSDIPVAIQSKPSETAKEEVAPWAKKVLGAGEATAALIANPVISTVGAVKGIVGSLPSIATGKAPEIAAQIASQFEKEHGYSPTSEEGKRYLQSIGETFQGLVEKATGSNMPLPPVIPELAGITAGRTAAGQIEKQFEKAKVGAKPSAQVFEFPTQERPAMVGVGAAQTTNKATLESAIAQASPELKRELAKIDPNTLNKDALNRQLEADSLPTPVRLTPGQASQDPVLISRERNERGYKEQYAQHFNEQNKALQESATLMKDRVAPNIFTTDHVADAGNIIDEIKSIQKANSDATKLAYKNLEDANGGKFPVDSKTFGQNAIAALSVNDETEFLPATIKAKVDSYAKGKEMNFNQFENLRTQIARETRKAQRAEDGNAVHALGLVRQELENLPMPGASAELKKLADEARSKAKYDFDLEKQNDLYNKVVNEATDTKDFVKKFVLDSKNADFANSMDLLKDNPKALEHLRSGALDYIIRESTDASGNFKTATFAKYINNLDLNKKLDALFGADAETLRNIAKTGTYVESRPKGSFVNESNTAVAQFAKEYGGKLLEKVPGVKYVAAPVNIAREVIAERKLKKQISESLKPGAGVGTKLKDLGKKNGNR